MKQKTGLSSSNGWRVSLVVMVVKVCGGGDDEEESACKAKNKEVLVVMS